VNRFLRMLCALSLLAGAPAAALADTENEAGADSLSWGGEIRLHTAGVDGTEGLGRTGGLFETRLSLDAPLAERVRLYGVIGSGIEQGADQAGLHQLYLDYEIGPKDAMGLRAGFIPMPFGRWNAVTLSRPLIKSQVFSLGNSRDFLMQRSSAGLSFHAAGGLFESDVAVLDQAPAEEFRIERDDGVDAVQRFGVRGGGLSAGVSFIEGRRGGDSPTAGPGVERTSVSAKGVDLIWSRGAFSVGGEALVLMLGGRRNSGYYLQGTLDLSRFARGLRLLAKHDVLDVGGGPTLGTYHRETIGLKQALRRDLDLEVELNRDRGDGSLPDFGGKHLVLGLRYRF